MNTRLNPINLSGVGLIDLGGELLDEEIRHAVTDCIGAQKGTAAGLLKNSDPIRHQ